MFAIRPMTEADASAIAEWHYPGAFAFYDWRQDPDDLAELLDPAEWGRRYFAAFNGRAMTVYARAGFVATERYEHWTNGSLHPFIRMARGPLAPQ